MTYPVKSPCIGICSLDDETGYCKGCFRTGDEVARWLTMREEEKQEVLGKLNERRDAL